MNIDNPSFSSAVVEVQHPRRRMLTFPFRRMLTGAAGICSQHFLTHLSVLVLDVVCCACMDAYVLRCLSLKTSKALPVGSGGPSSARP